MENGSAWLRTSNVGLQLGYARQSDRAVSVHVPGTHDYEATPMILCTCARTPITRTAHCWLHPHLENLAAAARTCMKKSFGDGYERRDSGVFLRPAVRVVAY